VLSRSGNNQLYLYGSKFVEKVLGHLEIIAGATGFWTF